MVTRLREAVADDSDAAQVLLQACLLMGLDPGEQFGRQYVLAIDSSGALVGMAGVEIHGGDGLLRSVAIAEAIRSRGLGGELTQNRIHWARSRRLGALYLLTTTGESYFTRHGFSRIARELAPAAIASPHQWSSACPASSTAMRRVLSD